MHKRAALWGCCLLLIAPLATVAADSAEDSVVKVIATVRFPDPTRPWAKPQAAVTVGTGAIIDGKRILTNAHVVMYASDLHVQAGSGDDKVEAKIEALGQDVDLAVLSVKDAKFLDNKPALLRSRQLPKVQENVAVYGFPIGGRQMSVTKGTISRLDVGNYGNRGPGFVIQISAAVNPGNSGGPALVDGKMVGVVVSRVINAQNISSVIPNEEVDYFLDDIKDGRYDGKPVENSRVMYQSLVNEALRGMLRIGGEVRGVLARVPEPPDGDYPLKQFDIVTKIGKYEIDNTGMVNVGNGLRAPFLYLVPRLARGGTVPLTIHRTGRTLEVAMPVFTRDNRLLRPYQGEPLSYFIHGPLVFTTAKSDDIQIYGQLNPLLFRENSPLIIREFDNVRFPGEELVVVSAPMFPHRITRGYTSPAGKAVKDVNGNRVKNLRHLVEIMRDTKDKYMRFRFGDELSEVLVFDRLEMDRATGEIMEDQGIAPGRRGSADMLRVWAGKGAAGR